MIILFAFIASFITDLVTDILMIRKAKSPKHGWSALYRSIGIGAGCWFEYQMWLIALVAFVALTLLYWIVFDLMINVAMGWDLLYSGKTSTLDRLLGQISDEKEVIIKVSALVLAMIGFVLIYKSQEKNKNPYEKDNPL